MGRVVLVLGLVGGLVGCGAENGRDLAGVNVAPIIHCTRAQSTTTVTVGDVTVDCGKKPAVVPPVVVVGEPPAEAPPTPQP